MNHLDIVEKLKSIYKVYILFVLICNNFFSYFVSYWKYVEMFDTVRLSVVRYFYLEILILY